MRSSRAATIAFGAALLGSLAGPLQAQEIAPVPARLVTVRVVTDPDGAPLGYGVVAFPDLALERFTSPTGVVVMPVLTPGRVRVVVKRLGFTPKDTSITVTDAPAQTFVIALARVTFKLDVVRVVAWPPCKRPGITRRDVDPQVRGIVDQLRQNAERYSLFARTYPFAYASSREVGQREMDGTERVERTDTILVNEASGWRYRPGALVDREKVPESRRRVVLGDWIMHIPTLANLAEDAFVASHCFNVAGLEDKEGERLLRLDILAAERINGADVNVVAWLDPTGFRLRYATFTLSTIPRQFRDLLHVSSSVRYLELTPYVPVMRETFTESLVQEGRSSTVTRVHFERQRILRFLFDGPRPDGLPIDSLPPAASDR